MLAVRIVTTSPRVSRSVAGAAALAICLLVPLSAAGPSAVARTAHDPTRLVVARDLSDVRTLDPGRLFEPSAAVAMGNVYDPLVTIQGEDVTHPRPDLATRWTISGGGRVFTFYLRHGVRFSNGDPLTAADVVFSYRRLGYLDDNPAFLFGAHTVGNRVVIDGVNAVGRYAVRLTLPEPDASFIAALTAPEFGVLDARIVRAHGGQDGPNAAASDRATAWLDTHSIGTGAFVLTGWTRGASGQILLRRNPYYWGARPSLDHITFRGVPSAASEQLEVDRGTVDIAYSVSVDGARSLGHDPNVAVVTGNTLELIYLAMRTNAAISVPLSKPWVRRAIRLALNYTLIIRGLLSGIGTQPNGMIPVGLLGNDVAANARLRPRTNLAEARRLMRLAGYPDGFPITMQYPAAFTFEGVSFDLLAPLVAQELSGIGIKVRFDATPLSVLLPAWRAGKQDPLLLWAWVNEFPDPGDDANAFASGGFNARHVDYTWDTAMAQLVKQASSTLNVAKRVQLYQRIQQSWLQTGPWAPIVQPAGIVILHHGVTNFQFSPAFPNSLSFVRKQ
jgi:peptide/nickel transport system substrate-binding protein